NHEKHPQNIRRGEDRLGPKRPGEQEPERGERARAQEHETRGDEDPQGGRFPAQFNADPAQTHPLQPLAPPAPENFPAEKAAATEGSGGKHAQRTCAALESRGDGLTRERTGHHREGEHPGGDDLHPVGGLNSDEGRGREEDEDHRGQNQAEEQLFAVAQRHPQLVARVREDAPRGRGRELVSGHCNVLPVRSRKTSSSERRETVRPRRPAQSWSSRKSALPNVPDTFTEVVAAAGAASRLTRTATVPWARIRPESMM